MAVILRNVPIAEDQSIVAVRGEGIVIHENQLVVWVAIRRKGIDFPPPLTDALPAILDPGFIHNFFLRDDHFFQWAGYRQEDTGVIGVRRFFGHLLPLRPFNLWVFRNKYGRRDDLSRAVPFLMELADGLAVNLPGHGAPRLPLVGLKPFLTHRLRLTVDGVKRSFSLR
jgi:hypothetical protein